MDDRTGRVQQAGRDAEMPDPALFWRWVGRATRPVVGWVLTGLGALFLLVGYLGVSREAIVAKQLPYLISGGIGGLVLVVVGAVFLGTEDLRRDSGRLDRLEAMVEELHRALLVRTDVAAAPGERPRSEPLTVESLVHADADGNGHPERTAQGGSRRGQYVMVPQGRSYHRVDCPMVAGKEQVQRVAQATVERRRLEPCRLCEPEPADVR